MSYSAKKPNGSSVACSDPKPSSTRLPTPLDEITDYGLDAPLNPLGQSGTGVARAGGEDLQKVDGPVGRLQRVPDILFRCVGPGRVQDRWLVRLVDVLGRVAEVVEPPELRGPGASARLAKCRSPPSESRGFGKVAWPLAKRNVLPDDAVKGIEGGGARSHRNQRSASLSAQFEAETFPGRRQGESPRACLAG